MAAEASSAPDVPQANVGFGNMAALAHNLRQNEGGVSWVGKAMNALGVGGESNHPSPDPLVCIRPGCRKPSFNGNPGEFCSRYCRANRNKPVQAEVVHAVQPAGANPFLCVRPQCGKPSWNEMSEEYCS